MDGNQRENAVVRVGAVADLHCTRDSAGQFAWLAQVNSHCDLLLLAGDLTDYGLPEEARVLLRELSPVKVPIVAVLGNHDFESGQAADVSSVLKEGGVRVLDGESCEILGVGIAGVKGFGGGFGRGMLGAWGEDAVKLFVQAAIDETMKLESALARLRTRHRIALLHYSPVEATVRGEPAEIFPFLGCGRLAEPIARYAVSTVFHGHAHRGTAEGKIGENSAVYNVALPLLKSRQSGGLPIRVVDFPLQEEKDSLARPA